MVSPSTALSCCHDVSPEPAQDDHGHSERDQRGAIAHSVQSLHRDVVHVLQQKHKYDKHVSKVFVTQ